MAQLRFLWVIYTTSKEDDANTDDGFDLVLRSPFPGGGEKKIRFPDLPHDEREKGRTDEYVFEIQESGYDLDALGPQHIGISSRGKDAWLPKSIWVIGEGIDGRRRLLVAQPTWPPEKWFSKETSDAGGKALPTRFLD